MSRLAGFSRRGWPGLALVASLVLNAFLVGVVVADASRGDHRRPGARIGGFELRRLADRLPDAAVEQIAAELEVHRPGVEARVEKLRAMREEVIALAAQPNPDRAVLDERLAAMRAEFSALQEDVQRATYDALLELPPDIRAGLAEDPENS